MRSVVQHTARDAAEFESLGVTDSRSGRNDRGPKTALQMDAR